MKQEQPTTPQTDTNADYTKQSVITDKKNAPIVHKALTKNQKESARVSKILQNVKNSNVADLLKNFKPVIDVATKTLDFLAPYILLAYSYANKLYQYLPTDVFYALIGLMITFFGGCFTISIAAIESFVVTGWETFRKSGTCIFNEFKGMWIKSREDDKKDEDGDGVADILKLKPGELVSRKVGLYFANCSDPQHMMDCIGALAGSVFGVIAVLKVDFAKTIALGATIGESLRKPASYFIVPIASKALPSKYHQWIAPGINFVCKSVAISIAWFIQRIISSVHSAIRGGLIFSRRMLKYANDKGYIQFNDEESYLDEIVGWSLAALGIYFQLSSFFTLPFPLNVVFFPMTILENYLAWIISE